MERKYYNLTQLISRFGCLYLKESKCCKWQDGNFTNNLTLLILFILYHYCWNIQMCWLYGCVGCMAVLDVWMCWMYGCVGRIDVLDVWLCWMYGCVGRMDVLDVWMCWTYGCVGRMDVLDVWMCWMYGCAFKSNLFTASFCLTFTTCHLHNIKQTLPYVKISNLLSSNLSPTFSYSSQLANCLNHPTPLLPNRINSQHLKYFVSIGRLT